ncbi:MAG: ABC transporter ATP-binding protein [Oscillospiraceae bacterium]|nr:ABC transporter ATP-binding protein [Oscillospiraceae bacterium]
MYEPESGCITLDGTDVAELDHDTIRNNIGTVTQSPYLFNMSIRDNFRLVKNDVTNEEIEEVCMTACIHDDIMNMTNGYDTVVGEGGCMLSGGQRQRIALARALLKNYHIIMLDEATSALDNETRAIVRDAIKNMHGRSTVLMIAHRLSTVINCEQHFYFDRGKLLASCTHEELLKNCEEYRKLYAEEAD